MTQQETTTPIPEPPPPARRKIRSVLRAVGVVLAYAAMVCIAGWATLTVYYADRSTSPPRHLAAALVAIVSLVVLFVIRPKRYGLGAFALLFVIVLCWYFSLKPSNTRDWAPDVSVLPWAEIQGNRMVVHNLRCFDYRTETDFTPTWRDQVYDLDKLASLDISMCYWGSKLIAHGIVSFGFTDGQYLAISIECRKERTESYSAVEGFFRQYELFYVLADERDLIRLRTNYRHEDVYLYHTRSTPLRTRAVLLSYVDTVNSLRDKPQWYNALTTNCITSIIPHARAGRSDAHNSWRTLVAGYAAQQAYLNGSLDDSMPFEQLQARSHVNDAAVSAPNDPSFSTVIRATLPVPDGSGSSPPAIAATTQPRS